MRWNFRVLLVLGSLLALVPDPWARAQNPATLPAPTETLPPPRSSETELLPYVLPPVGQLAEPPELHPNPLLDRPGWPLPGCFVNVEAGILNVQLRNQLVNTVPITLTRMDTVQFPGVKLDWTVSPTFEFGYRLCDGLGDLQIGYRFLVSRGQGTAPGDPGSADGAPETGRLDAHILDFTYVSRQFSLAPCWDLRTLFGLRMETVYFDSAIRAVSDRDTFGGGLAAERETSHFQGLGPHWGVELAKLWEGCNLSLFVRAEGASLFGRIHQSFEEDISINSLDNPGRIGYTAATRPLTTWWAKAQVGISYTIPRWNFSRCMVGYEFEQWWDIGKLEDAFGAGSRADITAHGLFLRGEFNF